MTESFESTTPLFGANSVYIEELYERYLTDPTSVDESWQGYFKSMKNGANETVTLHPSWTDSITKVIGAVSEEEQTEKAKATKGKGSAISAEALEKAAQESVRISMMIRAYRVRGHLLANLDPLGLEDNGTHSELDPKTYGFTDEDMDHEIYVGGSLGVKSATVREVVNILRKTYCQNIGWEFMHIQDPDQKLWIQKHIEGGIPHFSAEQKKEILEKLVEVEAFESFLQTKYPGMKRFSVQGGDALVPGMDSIIHTAVKEGVQEIIFGMPHRGRINVLTAIMGKPYSEMLSLFHGNMDFPEWVESSGDVKYHLGTSSDRVIDGHKLHMSLLSNPSHLEAVNPVVVGKTRAKLDMLGATEHKNEVMGVQLHGDAAFAGQGVVAETLSLSELRGYRTGGSLHIIVNNQIGFTTSPKYGRFTPYPSDMAKAVMAPIFHVNGDDPEAVAFVCKLAVKFRQEFKRDVVVDIFCYRKYGHNEGDEPMFTQPIMYKKIAEHPLPATIYADKLKDEKVVDDAYVQSRFDAYKARFEKDFESGRDHKPNKADWLEGSWTGFEKPGDDHDQGKTGVALKKLKEVGTAISTIPKNITLNSKIIRQLKAKRQMIDTGERFDWATAEALAFGTLVTEGYGVRLSGQDSCRGTFSQRHSVLIDQNNEERYVPLANLGANQKPFEVYDSSLSEFALLGFEYGYSLGQPNYLTLWEAQFGDFCNGAQIMIDQFIVSGEIKWLRMSGLVMLLPHGYEGQGPEHSSARLERFLQLCGEDNIQVANCTTPANYFHILRRQMVRKFRKPLIIMTPKSLLRHKLAVSTLNEMKEGTQFQRVIPEIDKIAADGKVKRLVLCSGKVYYDLLEARREKKIEDVALVRVEQYYPFPEKELTEQLKKYKNAELMWCQEEPQNMGAWTFIRPNLQQLLDDLGRSNERVGYSGRNIAASPATGYLSIHTKQQQRLVDAALDAKDVKKKAA